jgi:type IV pilus assembly protein PilO
MALELNFDLDEKLEQLAKIPKAIRLAVVSGLLVALAAGYWWTSYKPAQEERSALTLRAQELQRELNNARSVASNVPAFEAEIAELERSLELALKQLPNRKQFEDLLQDISTAGKKVGVQIKSIDRDKEVRRDFYAEVPFELELEGSYHDLARFFEMVANLPRIVNVGGLNIEVAKETQQATWLKVKGRATTFRFLSDEA